MIRTRTNKRSVVNKLSNGKTFDKSITGVTISGLRKEKELTQNQLAGILHISTSTLSHYEQGVCLPPHQTLIAIADYFKVPVDYLLRRCQCKYEYCCLEHKFYNDMSYGEIINLLVDMKPQERHLFYHGLKLIKNNKRLR